MSLSITSVKEIPPESAETDQSAGPKTTRRFLVAFNEASYLILGQSLTASSGGVTVPSIGDSWPAAISGYRTPIATAIRSAPVQNNQKQAIVTVEYSIPRGQGADANEEAIPPWQQPKVYSYDFRSEMRPMEYDHTATPKRVCNAAGDPFDPQPEEEKVSQVVTINRATTAYSPSAALSIHGTVNSGAVTINGASISAKCARLLKWTGRLAYWTDLSNAEIPYYEETIEIEVRASAYTLSILNQGYGAIVSGAYKRGVDADGRSWPSPRLLAADGTELAIGGTPVLLTFEPHASASWSALGSL